MPLDNKCWIRQLTWFPLQACGVMSVCAVVMSTENESGLIADDQVSSWSRSNLPGVDKNPTIIVYDACSVVGFLMDIGSLYQR